MKRDIILSGVGGQGILSIATVIGAAALKEGLHIKQAEEYGHSLLREYAFLIAHSMLHLFGYDHMEEVERKEMEMHQKKIMELVNITR